MDTTNPALNSNRSKHLKQIVWSLREVKLMKGECLNVYIYRLHPNYYVRVLMYMLSTHVQRHSASQIHANQDARNILPKYIFLILVLLPTDALLFLLRCMSIAGCIKWYSIYCDQLKLLPTMIYFTGQDMTSRISSTHKHYEACKTNGEINLLTKKLIRIFKFAYLQRWFACCTFLVSTFFGSGR